MHTPAVKNHSDLSVSSILTHAGASSKLVSLPSGKMTAGSTLKTQTDAFSLGLSHTHKGSAGTAAAASSATSTSSSSVISALTSLPISGF